eukprot:TRINITY_DN1769_c0_g2_i1.p1 TRINITY_DN1769_c0_g2~~TRINITY_DN1769_c0_g2_i1.p1  ORF type:complete len:515 (-),score=198.63 TRINITY_DN1769_c0_g2_i1:60-1604(-)
MSAKDAGKDLVLPEGDKRRDPSNDFALKEKLGEGSYGSVWLAVHTKSGTPTAIKRVPVENGLEEIINEIRIMKNCRSPYIVSYFGSYFKGNELWIVMEHCGAGSACDLMRICDKTFTEEQIAIVIRDALRGLSYLHGVKKIHRDIKAGNILLNMKGESKLADFGVSGQISDTMAKRQTVIGTPFWMAPEVIQEVGYDFKADIWSLGITVLELAEGKPPLSNIHPMRAIFMIPNKPPPVFATPEQWSKELADFLTECLTRAPGQRWAANDLLKHAFVAKAKSVTVMLPLIREAQQKIETLGREEALGLDNRSDSDDEPVSSPPRNRDQDDAEDSGQAYGTMIVNEDADDSGTMRQNATAKNYVPEFMQRFQASPAKEAAAASTSPAAAPTPTPPAAAKSSAAVSLGPKKRGSADEPKSPRSAAAAAASPSPRSAATPASASAAASAPASSESKSPPDARLNSPVQLSSLTTDQLKKALRELDDRMDKEIEAIKSKYTKARKEIEAAILEKKKKHR